MAKTFNGSNAKVLHLKLTSADQVEINKGAWSGSKVRKIVLEGLSAAEYKKARKELRDSGFKGRIVRK